MERTVEAKEGSQLGRDCWRVGKWVWRTRIKAHLLSQVDFESRVHDSRQQLLQDVPHHVLAFLQSRQRHPLSFSEPPRNDVHLRHWHRRRPCLFCLGSGHPTVSGLPLWERKRAISAGNPGVEQRSNYRLGRRFLKLSSSKEKPFERDDLLLVRAYRVTDAL